MTAFGVRWIGSRELNELPNSPHINDSVNGCTYTRMYKGPWDIVLRFAPRRGGSMVDTPGLKISQVQIHREPGSVGKLVVVLEGVEDGNDGDTLSDTGELRWIPVERPLSELPQYNGYGRDWWDAIDAWKREPNVYLRLNYQFRQSVVALGGNVSREEDISLDSQQQLIAQKINQGIESWVDYMPVARRIRTYTDQPAAEKCGALEAPSGVVVPAGYDWRRSSDDVVQQQNTTWTRTTEWSGVSGLWDRDLYGPTADAGEDE